VSRKPRIEFAGAIYHVISRGNYRKDLFTMSGSGAAFEKALFEVCQRTGWKLHAYVIMSNHYHLALETPEGNLVEGMRWLQGTFGNRFNRFTGERGHVFQGRYKSLLVEPGEAVLGLVNYIHLNPVRAGIVEFQNLRNHRLSSFPKFFRRMPIECLKRVDFLGQAGFPDSLYGMKRYAEYLSLQGAPDPKERAELQKKYSHGWAIASKEYKKELSKTYEKMTVAKDWGGVELKELNESKWENRVTDQLARLSKTEEDVASDRKLAEWKQIIARDLRENSPASNPWIARRLNMGHPSNITWALRQTHKS
jgi:REP element-mobilizing transposase RayT